MSRDKTVETASVLLRESDIDILNKQYNARLSGKQGTRSESSIIGDSAKSSDNPSKPFDSDQLATLSLSILKATGIASNKVPETVFGYAIHACQKGAEAFVDMARNFSGVTQASENSNNKGLASAVQKSSGFSLNS